MVKAPSWKAEPQQLQQWTPGGQGLVVSLHTSCGQFFLCGLARSLFVASWAGLNLAEPRAPVQSICFLQCSMCMCA